MNEHLTNVETKALQLLNVLPTGRELTQKAREPGCLSLRTVSPAKGLARLSGESGRD